MRIVPTLLSYEWRLDFGDESREGLCTERSTLFATLATRAMLSHLRGCR